MPGAIPALDAVRACAIILVLLRHAVRPFWDEGGQALFPVAGWDLAIPMINGWVGVDLFFVLSGYLIGRQLLSARAKGQRGSRAFGRYLLKRALRILPAYYAVLMLAVIGLVPLFTVAPEHIGLRIAWHALMLQDYLPSNIVVVFWSLGVEEKFYLVAPAIVTVVLLMPSRSLQYACLVALSACGLLFRYFTDLAHPEPIGYEAFFPIFRSPFHLCLEPLILGLLAALVHSNWRQPSPWLARGIFWAGVAGAAALLAAEPMLDVIDQSDRLWLPTLIALAMALCVFGAAAGGAPGAIARPGLIVTARLSYVLYLVHLMVIPGAMALVDSIFGGASWSVADRFLIFFPVFLALSYGAALLIHLAVERPFLKLKDRLA